MKKIGLLFVTILFVAQVNAQTSIFNDLLHKHVTEEGIVDYKSFKKDALKLDNYISYLERTSPEKSWSQDQQKAFWINAYNEILRKTLFDARIHVGVNCASGSCPKLSNIAFTEDNIDAELERLMKDFVNDSLRNKISNKKIQISSIFDWFQDDFTKKGSLISYLNTYSETKISPKAKISYLKYDWTLNGK